MNRIDSLALVLVALFPLASLGCGTDAKDAPSSSAPAAENRIDAVMADVETGHDPARRAELEALLGAPSVSKSDHAKMALALSRLVEATDRERAIQLTEDAVAAESDEAEGRLFTLLTGAKPPSPWRRRGPSAPVANSARALAKYFPPATAERTVDIRIEIFGGDDGGGPWPTGTYDIGGALRANAEEACGLCEEPKARVGTHSSRTATWTSIPRALPNLDQALVVTYVDIETLPPARYEKWFAAPLADIKSAIEEGKGLVAVKERPGAPPLVTIAAPRAGLLPLVEAQFAEMSELPLTAKRVAVDTHLSKDEVRAGFRTRHGAFKTCYADLIARKSGAAGTIEVSYGIKANGSVVDVTTSVNGSLDDPAFRGCIAEAASTIRYPRWTWKANANDVTTVRYPLTMAH